MSDIVKFLVLKNKILFHISIKRKFPVFMRSDSAAKQMSEKYKFGAKKQTVKMNQPPYWRETENLQIH